MQKDRLISVISSILTIWMSYEAQENSFNFVHFYIRTVAGMLMARARTQCRSLFHKGIHALEYLNLK